MRLIHTFRHVALLLIAVILLGACGSSAPAGITPTAEREAPAVTPTSRGGDMSELTPTIPPATPATSRAASPTAMATPTVDVIATAASTATPTGTAAATPTVEATFTAPATATVEYVQYTAEYSQGYRAFSLEAPRDWTVKDEDPAMVQWVEPNQEALIQVSYKDLGVKLSRRQLRQARLLGLGDESKYTIEEVRPQADGSIGIAYTIKGARPWRANAFIEQQGTVLFMIVAEAREDVVSRHEAVLSHALETYRPYPDERPSGTVLYEDDFSDRRSGWVAYDRPDGFAGYTRGRSDKAVYKISLRDPNKQYYATVPDDWNVPGNVRVEVDVMRTDRFNDITLDYRGIRCRQNEDASQYYIAMIDASGYYLIAKRTRAGFEALSEKWKKAAVIKKGSNVTNHLRVDCVGDTITLYVNGKQLAKVKDRAPLSGGTVALIHATDPESGVTGTEFDNLQLLKP